MYFDKHAIWHSDNAFIKTFRFFLVVLSFAISGTELFAQTNNRNIDSLQQIITTNQQDSSTVRAFLLLSKSNLHSNPAQSKIEAEKALSMAQRIGWKRGMAECHKLIGVIYYELYAYKTTIAHYDSALQLVKPKSDGDLIADLYNNLGNAYSELGDHPKALEYHFKSLNMNETINNQVGVSTNCLNIGSFYTTKFSNYVDGLRYLKKSLEASTRIKDTVLMSEGLIGIALIYNRQGKKDSALNLYRQAYILDNVIQNYRGLSISSNNMGSIYLEKKDLDFADSLFHISLATCKRAGLKGILITVLKNLGSLNIDRAKTKTVNTSKEYIEQARQYVYEGIDSASSGGVADTPYTYYKVLSDLDELSGNASRALYFFKKGQKIEDSIYSKENAEHISLLEKEREQFEQQRAQDARKASARIAKTIQLLSIFTGILILVSMIIFLTSKKLNHRLIHFLGTLSVIAVFELISILIHPFLERITHHNLIYMLLCLVLIASFIIPLHHQVEKMVKEFITKRIMKVHAIEKRKK